MTFGDRLRMVRSKKGMNQDTVADAIGIKQTAYSNYETNFRFPSKEVLIRISDFLDVSLDYLIKGVSKYEKSSYNEPIHVVKSLYPSSRNMIQKYEYLPDFMPVGIQEEGYFYLEVSQDNMVSDRIKIGDMLLISTKEKVRDNILILALGNESDTILGRIYHHNSLTIVQPENSKYKPYIFSEEDVKQGKLRIAGIVVLGQYHVTEGNTIESTVNKSKSQNNNYIETDELQKRMDEIL